MERQYGKKQKNYFQQDLTTFIIAEKGDRCSFFNHLGAYVQKRIVYIGLNQ